MWRVFRGRRVLIYEFPSAPPPFHRRQISWASLRWRRFRAHQEMSSSRYFPEDEYGFITPVLRDDSAAEYEHTRALPLHGFITTMKLAECAVALRSPTSVSVVLA